MDRQELEQVAIAYIGAWEAGDWAQLEQILAPGVVRDDMSTGRRAEGPAAVLDAIRRLHDQASPLEIAPSQWLVDEANNMIATELFVRGLDGDARPTMYGTIFLGITDGGQIGRIRTLYQVVVVDGSLLCGLCAQLDPPQE